MNQIELTARDKIEADNFAQFGSSLAELAFKRPDLQHGGHAMACAIGFAATMAQLAVQQSTIKRSAAEEKQVVRAFTSDLCKMLMCNAEEA